LIRGLLTTFLLSEVKMNNPDFYLSSMMETEILRSTRACWIRGRLNDGVSDGHLLVEINPPVTSERYCKAGDKIINLILSPKWVGYPLSPIKEWPCHVYVYLILDGTVINTLRAKRDQIEMIAWAAIFKTPEDAISYGGGPYVPDMLSIDTVSAGN
jgi:hypothetical protein